MNPLTAFRETLHRHRTSPKSVPARSPFLDPLLPLCWPKAIGVPQDSHFPLRGVGRGERFEPVLEGIFWHGRIGEIRPTESELKGLHHHAVSRFVNDVGPRYCAHS
jgi:hypothetical protein